MKAKTIFNSATANLFEISQSALLHKNKIVMFILGIFLLIFLWHLPKLLLDKFFSPAPIKKALNEYSLNSNLGVTFDGLTAQPFSGISLQNPRISWESDFNKGKIFFSAPEVKLKTSFLGVYRDSLPVIQAISAIDAEINIFFEDGKIPANVSRQLELWMASSLKIPFSCKNCKARFYFRSGTYRKEIWLIENLQFVSQENNEPGNMRVQYNSRRFGNGSLQYKIPSCFSQGCPIDSGEIQWEGEGLNLEILNAFAKNWEFKDSVVSGKIKSTRKISEPAKGKYSPENDLITAEGNIDIPSIKIFSEDEISYSEENITALFLIKRENQKWSSEISGKLRNRNYDLKIHGLGAAILPATWSFRLDPPEKQQDNDTVRLPYDISLNGLKRLQIQMTPYKKTDYRVVDASWEIYNGSLSHMHSAKSAGPVYLDLFKGQIRDDKLSTELTGHFINTNFRAELDGTFYVKSREYREVTDYLRRNAPTVNRQIFSFESKLRGLLRSDKTYYADLEPEINRALLWWNKETINGLQYSWMTPKFREREIFTRLLNYLNLDVTIDLPQVEYNNGLLFGMKGKLQAASAWQNMSLDISSEDKKNYLYVSASYITNFPYVTLESRIELPNCFPVLRPWLPSEFFEHFSDATLEFYFNGMGERPTGLYLSGRAQGSLSARNVRLGKYAVRSQLPLQWETISAKFDSHKEQGNIRSFSGENASFSMTGYGYWKEGNLEKAWDIKPRVIQKSVR